MYFIIATEIIKIAFVFALQLEKVEDHSLPKKARNGDEADIPQPSTSTKDKHETPGNFEKKFEKKLLTFVGKETDRDQMEPIFISEIDEKVWGYPVCLDCTQKVTLHFISNTIYYQLFSQSTAYKMERLAMEMQPMR